jgi:hypothetical protein
MKDLHEGTMFHIRTKERTVMMMMMTMTTTVLEGKTAYGMART